MRTPLPGPPTEERRTTPGGVRWPEEDAAARNAAAFAVALAVELETSAPKDSRREAGARGGKAAVAHRGRWGVPIPCTTRYPRPSATLLFSLLYGRQRLGCHVTFRLNPTQTSAIFPHLSSSSRGRS